LLSDEQALEIAEQDSGGAKLACITFRAGATPAVATTAIPAASTTAEVRIGLARRAAISYPTSSTCH